MVGDGKGVELREDAAGVGLELLSRVDAARHRT